MEGKMKQIEEQKKEALQDLTNALRERYNENGAGVSDAMSDAIKEALKAYTNGDLDDEDLNNLMKAFQPAAGTILDPEPTITPELDSPFKDMGNLFEAVKKQTVNSDGRYDALRTLGDQLIEKNGKQTKFNNDLCNTMKEQLKQYNNDHSYGLQDSEIDALAGYIAGNKQLNLIN
jgi:hypothetical protein